MSIKGKVKWFNGQKGYGFIEREDKEKDVFVHSSAAQAASLELNEGDALTFEDENGEKGPSAVNLQKAKSYFNKFHKFWGRTYKILYLSCPNKICCWID